MNTKTLSLGILFTAFTQSLLASEADSTLAVRQQIEANLIAEYEARQQQPQIIEKIDFLERDGSKQPITIVHNRTLSDFHDFMDDWLSETSCVGNSPMRSASAYGLFATKLAAQGDYDEMRTLLAFARESMPANSRTLASIHLSLLSSFADMPDEEKSYWANSYQELLDSAPSPSLAIHYINKEIVEYLDSH